VIGVSMTLPQYYRRQCLVDGRVVRLTPSQTELIALLLASDPEFTFDIPSLIEALWPDPDLQPLTASEIIPVQISKLRAQGIRIKNEWGRGFRIPKEARAQPIAAERLAA
jgi:DNA-binding response OmpR family regulator